MRVPALGLSRLRGRRRRALAIGSAVLAAVVGVVGFQVSSASAARPGRSADGAVAWMASHAGSSAYEGYCEIAVEKAYFGHAGIVGDAISHYYKARAQGAIRTGTPPKGALVFYRLGNPHGHIAISAGGGKIWSTSVNGGIHKVSLHYFGGTYLGWANGTSSRAW